MSADRPGLHEPRQCSRCTNGMAEPDGNGLCPRCDRGARLDDACAVLAVHAGWATPPDWCDPFVVEIAHRAAVERATNDLERRAVERAHRTLTAARVGGVTR